MATGNLRASWGVQSNHASAPSGVSDGVVTDWGESNDPVAAPLQDEKGADIGHTVYDKHRTITMSVTCKAGTELPDVGALFTVGGVQGYVTSCSLTENNQSYMKFSVTIERWNANPIIATTY